jgi:hypothetical protein
MINQDLWLDPEKLNDPFPKSHWHRFAQTQSETHLFFDLRRDRQGYLCHWVAGGQFKQKKNYKANEQQGRDG